VVIGRYLDTAVTVIDDNCNGRFNDLGEDAVLVGSGALAAPLGPVVVLGRRVYNLQVSEDGKTMTFTPAAESKLGAAVVSDREGHRLLLGAILRGPGESFFAVGDRGPTLLPAGSYSFAFAALGKPGTEMAGLLESSGDLNLEVKERKVAVLKFGRPRMEVKVRYDERQDDVVIEPPNRDSVTCKAGRFRFFSPTGVPKVDVVRLGRRGNVTKFRNIRMPVDRRGNRPRALRLDRDKYDLDRGDRYRFEVTWANGLVQEAKSSATLTIPKRRRPAKKKGAGK
jgi:hypothetical protein